jgi:transcriptional regulator with XRE-family HTH domain
VELVKETPTVGSIWMKLWNLKGLKAAMRRKGISNRELARQVGWKSHSYMNRIVRGEVDTMETEPALKMAFLLDLGVDDLFLVEGSMNPGFESMKSDHAA